MVYMNKRPLTYFFVGLGVTLFNFVTYTLIARFIVNNNDLLWLSNLLATTMTVFVAFFAHSKITWKERKPTKGGVARFFIWNAFLAVAISPFFTYVFGLLTPLYELAFNICSAIHLPFDYDFVHSTGTFALTSIVVMILNYFFYDRLVFGKKQDSKSEES